MNLRRVMVTKGTSCAKSMVIPRALVVSVEIQKLDTLARFMASWLTLLDTLSTKSAPVPWCTIMFLI